MKNRFRSIGILALSLTALAASSPANAQTKQAPIQDTKTKQPNIIYVMLDDAGYNDFGAMGSTDIKTPVFDQMCKEGMRFTDHYSGSAVCAPTRCVLMTGLHTGHCRRRGNKAPAARDQTSDKKGLVFLEDEDLTVAESMQQAGYTTGGIGKWGLGNPGTTGSPDKQGFDHFLGYLDQVHAHNHFTDWLWNDGQRQETGKRYSHYLFEEDSLRFIREQSKNDKPFFLYLPYCLPHGAYEIPHDDPIYQDYKDKPWSQEVKNYAAMNARADQTVGKILELLKELKIDEDTIVFYTSDNGPNAAFAESIKSNAPFQGLKRSLHEGGIRAAMTVRWPGKIPAGKTSDFVWDMRDVFPTCCDLAGKPSPEHLDGISVLPVLLEQSSPQREHLYWEHPSSQQAVRMGKWKGIRVGTKNPIRLFDLSNDPGEATDVATDHADIVSRIATIMSQSNTPSPFWPLKERVVPRKPKGKGKGKGKGKAKSKVKISSTTIPTEPRGVLVLCLD